MDEPTETPPELSSLFRAGDIPFVFKVYPDAAYETGSCKFHMQLGGGRVLKPGELDDYAITIIDPKFLNDDLEVAMICDSSNPCYFKADFVMDSCRNRQLQNLNQYVLQNHATFPFDANKIFTRNTSWAEYARAPIPARTADISILSSAIYSESSSGCSALLKATAQRQHFAVEKRTRAVLIGVPAVPSGVPQKDEIQPLRAKQVKLSVQENPKLPVFSFMSPQSPQTSLQGCVFEERGMLRARVPSNQSYSKELLPVASATSESNPSALKTRFKGAETVPREPEAAQQAGSQRDTQLSETRESYMPWEGARLLSIVRHYGLYNYTNNNLIWNRIADINVIPGRTADSLKNYFIQHVKANPRIYGGTDNDVIQLALDQQRVGQLRNELAPEQILDMIKWPLEESID